MTTLQDAGTPELPASTPCADAPPLRIHPRLREYGEATPRGALPRVQVRDQERRLLAAQFREQHAQIEAARKRLASGQLTRPSVLGPLDTPTFLVPEFAGRGARFRLI